MQAGDSEKLLLPAGGTGPEEAGTRELFLQGIEEFNRGEFFAAHETWEQLWLKAAGAEKLFLQGTIQLAAAFYHWGRGNVPGALSLLRTGHSKLAGFPPVHRGIRVDRLRGQAAAWIEALGAGRQHAPGPPPRIAMAEEAAGAERS
jgi:predicted metal-dependent hydrolase